MALTPSTMLDLGTNLPHFSLTDTVSGDTITDSQFSGEPLLVMFICNHCPYVVHLKEAFAPLAAEYMPKGLNIVAINANSEMSHPQDGPEHMKKLAQKLGWKFPFCFDATQEIAKKFTAACTPDFFLYDQKGQLAYRGQFDDSRPGKGTASGKDIRDAIDAVLAGEKPNDDQKPSLGCNIKWAPGNSPSYF